MNLSVFNNFVALVSGYGYFVILIVMIFEGPIITTAAAFAASTGLLNIYIIYLISVLGDTIADILYYNIGFWTRTNLIEKYGKRFGLTGNMIDRVQHLLHKNAWKTLIAIKLAPGLAPAGLIAVGASNMSIKRYFKIVTAITLPKCLFFVVLGYYAGRANDAILKYFGLGVYGFPLVFIFILAIIYFYQKASKRLSERIEKI